MSDLTISCPVAALGANVTNKKEIYEHIYKEITQNLDEDAIEGIQLYPSGWPRKLQITVKSKDIKEKLLIEGLDIFDKHIEFRDENNTIVKVVVKDAPIEWTDDILMDIMQDYGEVVRMEKEMIYADGKKTSWTTGTRYIYLSSLTNHIPSRLEVTVSSAAFSLAVWYRGQSSDRLEKHDCWRCGSTSHTPKECLHQEKVCYICKSKSHSQKDCPMNDGTKRSDEAVVFLSAKSCLSNWNMEYPFEIEGQQYTCVEQYVMKEKCLLFHDQGVHSLSWNRHNPGT